MALFFLYVIGSLFKHFMDSTRRLLDTNVGLCLGIAIYLFDLKLYMSLLTRILFIIFGFNSTIFTHFKSNTQGRVNVRSFLNKSPQQSLFHILIK